MKTKILYYHVTPIEEYMTQTKMLIDNIKRYFSSRFDVIDCPTKKKSNDMGKHLGRHWGSAPLIIIGQDNVPNVTTLFEMDICDQKLCVNPCKSYPASTALNRTVLNQIDKDGKIYEEHERPEFAYYGGTGVSKISLQLQKEIVIDFDFGFPRFDSCLKDFGLVNWHCHYPLHAHSKISMRDKHWGPKS